MSIEMLRIRDIARNSGVPESTVRRYLRLFSEILPGRRIGRGLKYPAETVNVISTIAAMYRDGLGTEEVTSRLKAGLSEFLKPPPEAPYMTDEARDMWLAPLELEAVNKKLEAMEEAISALQEEVTGLKERLVSGGRSSGP